MVNFKAIAKVIIVVATMCFSQFALAYEVPALNSSGDGSCSFGGGNAWVWVFKDGDFSNLTLAQPPYLGGFATPFGISAVNSTNMYGYVDGFYQLYAYDGGSYPSPPDLNNPKCYAEWNIYGGNYYRSLGGNAGSNRILDFYPTYNATGTTGVLPLVFGGHVVVDGLIYDGATISISNSDTLQGTTTSFSFSGLYNASTTVNFGEGFYTGRIDLHVRNGLTAVPITQLLAFTVGSSGLVAVQIPPSTDFSSCAILTFDLGKCLLALTVPTDAQFSYQFQQLKQGVLSRFPLGYVTQFVSILSDSTAGSLTVIDATIPKGVVGSGSHIHLDLTHQLDYILNATSSSFNNSTASSTESFGTITLRYWTYIVDLLAFLYILRRILGGHLIPFGKEEIKK